LNDCSKIRTRRKIVIIFDHPSRTLVLDRRPEEPRRNFAFRNLSTREPWLFRSPVFGSGIRRLDGEVVGGAPREDPAETRHALAGDFDNRTTGSGTLFSRG
jgi:hypothetical protein